VQRERIQIAASELMSNQIKFATGAGFRPWHFRPFPGPHRRFFHGSDLRPWSGIHWQGCGHL
jgi:hypothetical protein